MEPANETDALTNKNSLLGWQVTVLAKWVEANADRLARLNASKREAAELATAEVQQDMLAHCERLGWPAPGWVHVTAANITHAYDCAGRRWHAGPKAPKPDPATVDDVKTLRRQLAAITRSLLFCIDRCGGAIPKEIKRVQGELQAFGSPDLPLYPDALAQPDPVGDLDVERVDGDENEEAA